MRIKELQNFLIEAKKNTYASTGEGGEKRFADGGKELHFSKGPFSYRDKYYGYKTFVGVEIVSYRNKAIWSMGYSGSLLSNKYDSKAIYSFLKTALKKVPTQQPFRGPKKLKQNSYEYINQARGNINKFDGIETIFLGNKKVYQLHYHGGLITE